MYLVGIFYLALLQSFTFTIVSSGGVVWINLKYYRTAAGGKAASGQCCDGLFMCQPHGCDPYFMFCLDLPGRKARDFRACAVSRHTTGTVYNQNVINFTRLVSAIENPFKMNFTVWPEEVVLKVKAYDADPGNAGDLLEVLTSTLTITPDTGQGNATSHAIELQARTLLRLDITIICDEHYYGNCTTYCRPNDDVAGHWECEDTTGERICLAGWTGPSCDIMIDTCGEVTCGNGGTCESMPGLKFLCHCASGFTGSLCQTDIDDCAGVPCGLHGSCVDGVDSMYCVCAEGYTGSVCDVQIDECTSKPCLNDATCMDHVNGYNCSCTLGYQGPHCEDHVDFCQSSPCDDTGSLCVNLEQTYSCVCPNHMTELACNTPIDPCHSSQCRNNATCMSHAEKTFLCVCSLGWTGTLCENRLPNCHSSPCKNDGVCKEGNNEFDCECLPGYSGSACETDVDECRQDVCQNNGVCENTVGSYECECQPHFSGAKCEVIMNHCLSNPCGNDASCTSINGQYACSCPRGWTGNDCSTDIDECSSQPCQNAATCLNRPGSFDCQCGDGWAGETCGKTLYPCVSQPCLNGGTCQNHPDMFTCVCDAGFTGLVCQIEDPCAVNPCGINAICMEPGDMPLTPANDKFRGLSYVCRCLNGTFARSCEDVDNRVISYLSEANGREIRTAPPIFLFLTETTNTVEKIVFEVEQRLARFLDCPLANVLVSYSSATCDNAQSYGISQEGFILVVRYMETPIHWHDVQKALGNDYINDISPIDPDSCQLTGAGSSKISVLHSNIYTKKWFSKYWFVVLCVFLGSLAITSQIIILLKYIRHRYLKRQTQKKKSLEKKALCQTPPPPSPRIAHKKAILHLDILPPLDKEILALRNGKCRMSYRTTSHQPQTIV